MSFHEALKAIASRVTFKSEQEYLDVIQAITDNESATQPSDADVEVADDSTPATV